MKNINLLFLLLILNLGCKNNSIKTTNTTESLISNNDTSCPPLKYSDNFKAIFIEETGCGNLNDVNFVYHYTSTGICGKSKWMVNMEKYNSFYDGEKCEDGKLIYRYEKK